MSSGCQKFLHPLQRRRVHAVAALENHAIRPAFTTALGTVPSCSSSTVGTTPPLRRLPPPSSSSPPRHTLGHHIAHHHCHAWEPRRPPSHHRHRVHAARLSPPCLGTARSSRPSPPPSPCRPAVTVTRSTPPRPLPPAAVWQTLSLSLSLSLCKLHFAVFECLTMQGWLLIQISITLSYMSDSLFTVLTHRIYMFTIMRMVN
jgi:hypothetical protein